ncbi:MAG: hypothetical protein ABR567_10305 [Myxococcales bacterium]
MIALLLAAAPFVDAFWSRDLGALQRELAEDAAPGEEHLLFDDLVKLATCAPLAPLKEASPLRELVRLEESRRGQKGTLWDDLSRNDFFRRAVWNPDLRSALRWPDEKERWPAETLLVSEASWGCKSAKPGSGPSIAPALVDSLPEEPAARVAYERAVLRYRQGAVEVGPRIVPALLDSGLRPAALFLRLEAGFDAPEGWIALAREWPAPAVTMRAAQRLYELGRHAELVQLTEQALPPSPMQRHVLLLRSLSLHTLGRDPEMLATLLRALALPGADQGLEPVRAIGLAALAREELDLRKVQKLSPSMETALEQIARRASAARNFPTAVAAAQILADNPDPRWRAQGLALQGEIGWRAGNAQRTAEAFEQLFDPKRKLAMFRDPAALQLAQTLVLDEAQRRDPARERKLLAQLDGLRAQVHLKALPQVEAMVVAARRAAVDEGEQPVALGELDVPLPSAPPPAPPIEIQLPEPRSLLAIPAADGSLRSWFDTGGPP